jgi:RNA polymerase sigma-70 factor (ECF subfamily)
MRAQKPSFDVIGQLSALRRYARSLTRDEHDAEDLVQDTLVRAYERRAGYDASRNIRVWLLSILHNAFIDGGRAKRAEAKRVLRAAELAPGAEGPAQEHHVRLADVRRAFLDLPDEQRSALHLVAIEGLSYAEAANALGIPSGTLMSRLARARATLRALEEADGRSRPDAPPRPSHLKIVGGSDEPSS